MASTDFPKLWIIEPSAPHDVTVILLHGRGSTGDEFADEFFDTYDSSGQSLRHRFPSARWVFPGTKRRVSTLFQGLLSEWYDVYSLTNPDTKLDLQRPGLGESVSYISRVIDSERQRFESQRPCVVLGGISMGCAVGVHVLLSLLASRCAQHIRGFFGWCGWMPFNQMLRNKVEGAIGDTSVLVQRLRDFYLDDIGITDQQAHAEPDFDAIPDIFSSVPVFLSHCNDDEMIASDLGRDLRDTLKFMQMDVRWKEYADGGHWIKEPEAVDEFTTFLEQLRKST